MVLRRMTGVVVVWLLLQLLAPPGAQGQPWLDDPVRILSLSNRADLISGGDALVEVVLPDRVDPADVTVAVGGRDVTASFAVRNDGRFYGRVEGLALGRNRLTARLSDGSGAYLDLVNHPAAGPAFAGPKVQPWVCTTEDAGLGPPMDEDCMVAEPVVNWFYKAASGRFETYDPANPPADLMMTTTDQGVTVPYIVRVERGTINRSIYDIAVLAQPGEDTFEPWSPLPTWNHKLYWNFGGDCKPWHQQTAPSGDITPGDTETIVFATVLIDMALSRGFAVGSSGLTTLGQDCNDVVSAEALSMVKEHVVETYGEVRYSMSQGSSGGSMQQHWIAANYPGLLDGIQPSASYPDVWETMLEAEDCHVMDHVFLDISPQLWANPDDQAEAAGYAAATTCRSLWDNPSGSSQYARTWLDPDYADGCGLTAEQVYNAETNPEGARCTVPDYQVALFGRRAEDGFANRPYDNVGVQYGLAALEAGDITPEQFVDLNVNVGGIDIDWNYQPERSVADPAALERAYLGGRITHGGEIDRVAIVDYRGTSNFEIHTDVHSHVVRARLDAANRHHDNQVYWNSSCPLVPCEPMILESFLLLDRWLAAVEADTSADPIEEKIVRNKPEDAVDACWLGPNNRTTDNELCATALPYYATPRLVAGAPMTDDILKCQLRPLDRGAYAVAFTDDQWALLEQAFPDGVCDYSLPGVEQQPPRGPWQTYQDGPDGRPLGDPPGSTPFGPEGPPPLVTRHGGANRLETAVAVSGWGVDSADTVVIARADEYADALAGAPLAVHLGAPLLLTDREALSPPTAEEIQRLGATQATLLGGEVALHPQVVADLEELGVTARRVEGPNRFATAVAIAAELPQSATMLLARGDGYADALAASGLGAATGTPIVLAEPNRLPPETAAAIADGAELLVIGGPAAVSDAVATEASGTFRRLAGDSRYATSAAVADEALARGITPAVTWLATGTDFPDGLVAGAAAGRDDGILLLVDGDDLAASPETRDWLAEHRSATSEIRIAGGTAAISDGVLQQLGT